MAKPKKSPARATIDAQQTVKVEGIDPWTGKPKEMLGPQNAWAQPRREERYGRVLMGNGPLTYRPSVAPNPIEPVRSVPGLTAPAAEDDDDLFREQSPEEVEAGWQRYREAIDAPPDWQPKSMREKREGQQRAFGSQLDYDAYDPEEAAKGSRWPYTDSGPEQAMRDLALGPRRQREHDQARLEAHYDPMTPDLEPFPSAAGGSPPPTGGGNVRPRRNWLGGLVGQPKPLAGKHSRGAVRRGGGDYMDQTTDDIDREDRKQDRADLTERVAYRGLQGFAVVGAAAGAFAQASRGNSGPLRNAYTIARGNRPGR